MGRSPGDAALIYLEKHVRFRMNWFAKRAAAPTRTIAATASPPAASRRHQCPDTRARSLRSSTSVCYCQERVYINLSMVDANLRLTYRAFVCLLHYDVRFGLRVIHSFNDANSSDEFSIDSNSSSLFVNKSFVPIIRNSCCSAPKLDVPLYSYA